MVKDFPMSKAEGVDKDFGQLVFDVKYDKEQFKDPGTIGLLLYRLAREREQANLLFNEIVKKLDEISQKLGAGPEKEIVSEIEEKMLTYIKSHQRVDAEQIQSAFEYRGQNAASARLNALYRKGLLMKGRAGKKVFYWARE